MTALATPLLCATAAAATVQISGTRTNISPGGAFGGRCAPAITVSFAPGTFVAQGSSNLGDFSYVASHCTASPPPGRYFDGQFEWQFADGMLFGTHDGTLSSTATPGLFDIVELLTFTGGAGRFVGASGQATAVGTVQFGSYLGQSASFGDARFLGSVTAAAVPEPASWLLAALALGAACWRPRAPCSRA